MKSRSQHRIRWMQRSLALALSLQAMPAWPASEQLRDLSGRLEYAFYAEDSRALQQNLQALTQLDTDDQATFQQALDYARWKLAQLLGKRDAALAQQSAQDCADSKPISKSDKVLAIQHALHAACLGMLEQLRPVRSLLYKRERVASLAQAVKLGRDLPQVQLVSAWLQAADAEPQDLASLRKLVTAYDGAAVSEADNAWGHAEACYLLGQAELAKRDTLAARNALERALLLAPDYRAAQVLQRSLTVK